MTVRDDAEALLDAARAAYGDHVSDPDARASLDRIFASVTRPVTVRDGAGERREVCAHLEALPRGAALGSETLQNLVGAFMRLEPSLRWYKRGGDAPNANEAYFDGHANAMIVGPGGLVPHGNAWLGVSLLAPGVRYPDHTHPPEETYLVLSDGEFSQDGVTWFTPGIGGTFFNPPGILHAMRSGAVPLFAMWALWADTRD